jgi:polyphosphate glucokinase
VNILGIDIGGTGIKAGIVDLTQGNLVGEYLRLKTPHPAKPQPILKVIETIIQHFNWQGPIGCGYPGVIKNQCIMTAANLDKDWIGLSLKNEFKKFTNQPVWTLNDADAAGLAEMYYGAGKEATGTTIMITIGTGIGTALFVDKILLPNTELGHMYLEEGAEAEAIASASARKKLELSWKHWTKNFQKVLEELKKLFSPNLFILGGGLVKKQDKFLEYIDIDIPHVIANLENEAGIVGAALAAKIYMKL